MLHMLVLPEHNALNRLFELCLHCVQIGCTFPGAYNAFRDVNVDFVSAS